MDTSYDLIVIGAGALGTFHAYHALATGATVALLEKDSRAQGATVRNFGQVVPSGMDSRWQQFGRESVKIYQTLQQQTDISVRAEGTIYIAANEEELQLLEELAAINRAQAYTSVLYTPAQCLEKYPGLNPAYVRGGLFFPDELTVEPRRMVHAVQQYLQAQGLEIYYNTPVIHCTEYGGRVHLETAQGTKFTAAKVIVCNGSDFKVLYPERFANSGIVVTKLHMLQTRPQPAGYRLPGSVLTGWTIRRYEAFHECPSYQAIKAKEDPQSPQRTWGVHILFKQAMDGSVILGDSHEYADAPAIDELGFDLREDINDFMIQEAKKIITLPDYTLQHRWAGVYSQCKDRDIFQHDVSENIHIVTAIGGKGMTGSAGFAKQHIEFLLNK